MQDIRDQILREMEERSLREAEYLAREFDRAAAEDRNAILSRVHFEQWLALTAREARLLPNL